MSLELFYKTYNQVVKQECSLLADTIQATPEADIMAAYNTFCVLQRTQHLYDDFANSLCELVDAEIIEVVVHDGAGKRMRNADGELEIVPQRVQHAVLRMPNGYATIPAYVMWLQALRNHARGEPNLLALAVLMNNVTDLLEDEDDSISDSDS